MTAAKTTTAPTGVTYHVADANNNHITLSQPSSSIAAQTVMFSYGGEIVVLTKQNILDLMPGFTAFANTGTLS